MPSKRILLSEKLQAVFGDRKSSESFSCAKSFCVALKQVHGRTLVKVEPSTLASHVKKTMKVPLVIGSGDGLWADEDFLSSEKIGLIIRTADCIPLVYWSARQQKVALIHAGWRGLAKGIHRAPFEDLERENFDPADTEVWAGPSLNGKNFEVQADMWTQFSDQMQQDAEVFEAHAESEHKRYFYPWIFLRKEFQDLALKSFNAPEYDTFNDSRFSSYRRCRQRGEKLELHNLSWIEARS